METSLLAIEGAILAKLTFDLFTNEYTWRVRSLIRKHLWRKNKCKHYSIASKESYSILELARMFKSHIKYLPKRKGERFASALTKMNLNNKIIRLSAKIKLRDYIKNFLMNNR